MCDTIVASASSTAKKITLFGKNSDRERSEAQAIEILPAAGYGSGAQLTCTYITIPQARRTHAVILSRPFWMWGAEMGANEHGVSIGNEAVFGRIPPSEEKALLGMDLLRLGLERGTTAVEALDVITELLGRYGQGGNCSRTQQSCYHNSFIIADPTEAFVLETMGPHWFVEKVRGVRAISNAFTIGTDVFRVSRELNALIRENQWSSDGTIDYAKSLTDGERDISGRTRCSRSTSLLRQRDGRVTAADMEAILRDHGGEGEGNPNWRPTQLEGPSVCAHATDQKPRGQTVGSLVSELDPKRQVHWITGTPVPCMSIFKPVFLDVPLPSRGPTLSEAFDPNALWWQHDRVQRAMLENPAMDLASLYAERDALEAEMRTRIAAVIGEGASERGRVVATCWQDAAALEARWLASADSLTASSVGAS